jgi:hypothetical protein
VINVNNTCLEEVARVEGRVQGRLNGQIRDFRLLVRDGSVILQGHTQTYYAKLLAQQVLMDFTQLPIRANEIDVGRPMERGNEPRAVKYDGNSSCRP